jgi:hypothetical protein
MLDTADVRSWVESFNRADEELYPQFIPNAQAWDFLDANMPLFDCPDADFAKTYAFRWWTFRKHIKRTDDGFVISEFLPAVEWAGKHNTISCAAGHHFHEGRWLRDRRFLRDYAAVWFRKGASPRTYTFWAAEAYRAMWRVTRDTAWLVDLLDDLIANYRGWEEKRRLPNGLFWQCDSHDGQEFSVGGSGVRPTINAAMSAEAGAIAHIADLAGRHDMAAAFRADAARIKALTLSLLWDDEAQFFKTRAYDGARGDYSNKPPYAHDTLVDVREEMGLTPWYFNLPDAGKGYEAAWRQLMDPQGFYAPFGPTTAEQRHPAFKVAYEGHECLWNGPSWPYLTCMTLDGLANLLNGPAQNVIGPADYFQTLMIYASSHRLTEDGVTRWWIDENLNPYTGDWISRTRLKNWAGTAWPLDKGGRERGKDYNHSTFCDLVITGLAGLRPRDDDVLEVNPLLPEGTWDWFCLDRVPYHGRTVTVLWDRTGQHYRRGAGLRVFCDGEEVARRDGLGRLTAAL